MRIKIPTSNYGLGWHHGKVHPLIGILPNAFSTWLMEAKVIHSIPTRSSCRENRRRLQLQIPRSTCENLIRSLRLAELAYIRRLAVTIPPSQHSGTFYEGTLVCRYTVRFTMENGSPPGLCLLALTCKQCKTSIQVAKGIGLNHFISSLEALQGNGLSEDIGVRNKAKHVRQPTALEINNSWAPQGGGQLHQACLPNGLDLENRKLWRPLEPNTQLLGNPAHLGTLHQMGGNVGDVVIGKLWNVPDENIGVVNLDSPSGPESPPPGLLSLLQDIEAQIGVRRGEQKDLKKNVSHLATFVQIEISEVRNSNNKMKKYFDSITGRMETMHSCLKIVEAKVDCIRTSKNNNPSVILGMEENAALATSSKKKPRHSAEN